MHWMNDTASHIAPRVQLVGYERVHLTLGLKKRLVFTVKADQMALWVDDKVGFKVLPGNTIK